MADPASVVQVNDDEVVDADTGAATQQARGLPAPKQPSADEVARHNLTHLPYRSWCPHCVACRKPNRHHRSQTHQERSVPVFCADYCFVRQPNEDLLTGLVGRLYPSRAVFATACDVKGPDDSGVDRLADFFKNSGITKLVYKSDQEPSIKKAIEVALSRVGKSGEARSDEPIEQAVPENSAVGKSASNGKAERAVQQVEDMLRTYLHALEGRIKRKIPMSHPIRRWLSVTS